MPNDKAHAHARAVGTINISDRAQKLLANSGEEKEFQAYLDKHRRLLSTVQGSSVVTGYRLQSGTIIWIISNPESQTTACFCPGD